MSPAADEHVGKREVVQVEMAKSQLVGTLHRPDGLVRSELAVLLLSFGQAPRSGSGGLAVRIAGALAASGYLVFRFDMPGLGESSGELPAEAEVFWRFVQEGGHVPFVWDLLGQLQERYSLTSLVLGGLCSGAITAVYAAAERLAVVKGLILLDPEFTLARIPPPQQPCARSRIRGSGTVVAGVLHSARVALNRSRFLSRMWGRCRRWRDGAGFGPATNEALKRKLVQVVDRSIPILALTASDSTRDRLREIITGARASACLTAIHVEQTNHLFLSGIGSEIVVESVRRWMQDNFAAGLSPLGLLGSQEHVGRS